MKDDKAQRWYDRQFYTRRQSWLFLGRWGGALTASRANRLARAIARVPHQGARECARRRNRSW